ncbi:MAG: FAD-dependent oxidoreductase [Burkholderiaceae bacterium]|jgi:NADPH-dependent glutamate synthase beta subunit-like oxidoreductase|nr:FAD-dependent oxidoreductase [Burkholderiaceae bacterium]
MAKNESEKPLCPVIEQLTAFRARIHSQACADPSARRALAAVTRIITEISLGRASESQFARLGQLALALPDSERELGAALQASLDAARDQWLSHITGSHCPAGVCFEPRIAPCQSACPAHIDIPSMMALVGHGRYSDSLDVLLKDTPLPDSCGLICPAPCESACVQKTTCQPVFIRPMKSVASRLRSVYPARKVAPSTGKKVAVVGAGPAGVTAAYYLAQRGHHVEIFDERAHPGGIMRYGIPNYRLPASCLNDEIDKVKALGVVIHTNHAIRSVVALRNQGFDAVFLAFGLQYSRRLGVPGDDLPFVLGGMDLLSTVRNGQDMKVGPHVIVIGGGNVAIDAAMTSFRQGAEKVQIWYRRTRREMPANPHEVEMALAEGVELVERWAPSQVMAGNQIEFTRMKTAPDAATTKPVTVRADHIIACIGQDADLSLL